MKTIARILAWIVWLAAIPWLIIGIVKYVRWIWTVLP
jgi:uncharacterized membrane protein YuzA (DUF378 family)